MIVLKATDEQKNLLDGVGEKHSSIVFTTDGAVNSVTSITCRKDKNYPKWALELLNQLEEVEHVPVPDEVED